MKKPIKIYVVIKERGDGHHCYDKELVTWFFDKEEAEDWADVQRVGIPYVTWDVEEVPGGTWDKG